MMKLLLFSIMTVAVIGVMVPSAFAFNHGDGTLNDAIHSTNAMINANYRQTCEESGMVWSGSGSLCLPFLTENEYRFEVENIYAKGAEYEEQCDQKYGPPFYNYREQFAYNDCMNDVQTWQLNQLDIADSRCCVQGIGGCLIATAAFGSEMAPQVQFLREIRDNTVLQTQSGTTFMNAFNQFYYSFSPQIADYERENPVFKEAVKVTLTPLLTSLTLLNYVDVDTEEEMLGYGIGIILLNIGMYFVAPAAIILQVKRWKSKN